MLARSTTRAVSSRAARSVIQFETKHNFARRLYSTQPDTPADAKKPSETPTRRQYSPFRVAFAKAVAPFMGYHLRTTTAIRETRPMYAQCAKASEIEDDFLIHDCHLPHTFQTWFQVTNLYVWLLTTRLRALQAPLGKYYVQELVNHYFLDMEDRMRAVLGATCPERIVRGHMNDMRAQWMGAGIALDQGLVRGDPEMAGAIWRNIFDARGSKEAESRRADASNPEKKAKPVAESELDLPRLLWVFTAHLRREVKRLEEIPDEAVRLGKIGAFGRIDNPNDALRVPEQRWEVDEVVALPSQVSKRSASVN